MRGEAEANALPCPYLEFITMRSDEVWYKQQFLSDGSGYLLCQPPRIARA